MTFSINKIPLEILEKMLDYQEKHGNQRNIEVFNKNLHSGIIDGGFNWALTEEGVDYWVEVLVFHNFK